MSVGSIGDSGFAYAGRLSQMNVRGSGGGSMPQSIPQSMPQMPDEMKSKLDSILKSGGSPQEMKASLEKTFTEFKNSDAFKQLPQEMRDQMEKMSSQGPPAFFDQGGDLMQQLGRQGESTRFRLFSQNESTTASSTESDLQASLLKLMGEIGKAD
jgi:hypothetical protein